MDNRDRLIPEVYVAMMELCIDKGHAGLAQNVPAGEIFTIEISEDYVGKCNPHANTEIENIPAFNWLIEYRGGLHMMIGPDGGSIIGGPESELQLLEAIKKARAA